MVQSCHKSNKTTAQVSNLCKFHKLGVNDWQKNPVKTRESLQRFTPILPPPTHTHLSLLIASGFGKGPAADYNGYPLSGQIVG